MPLLTDQETVSVPKHGAATLLGMAMLGILDRARLAYPAGMAFNRFTFSLLWGMSFQVTPQLCQACALRCSQDLQAPLQSVLHYMVRVARNTCAAEPVLLKRFALPREHAVDRAKRCCPIRVTSTVGACLLEPVLLLT